jgi:hypothetical protein
MQLPGKGDNETLEIVNPVKHTTTATDAVDGHVPGNGGTCVHIFGLVKFKRFGVSVFPVFHNDYNQKILINGCGCLILTSRLSRSQFSFARIKNC